MGATTVQNRFRSEARQKWGWVFLIVMAATMPGISRAASSDRWPESPVFPRVDPVVRAEPPEQPLLAYTIKIREFAPASTALVLDLPTHIAFANGLEIISEVTNDCFSYRTEDGDPEWVESPVVVNGPHALVFRTDQELFYAVDTENNQVVSFPKIDEPVMDSTDTIAGVELERPHDIMWNPGTGFLYVLNSTEPVLVRFSAFGVDEGVLDLSLWGEGYSRGLSLVGDRLFVAASKAGLILEIIDFETNEVLVHPTYGKVASAVAGSWETTGFIPNDIVYYDGYWYLSNFFHPWYAAGTDYNKYKLVRFRSWSDLETGRWEELSQLLPDGQIPYFFTVFRNDLYVAAFDALTVDDAIYRISSGLFFDGFELGTAGVWSAQ